MKLALVALLFLPFLAGCGGAPPENGALATAQSASQVVSVAKVESRTLNTTLPLPAQITPYEVVDVYPKVTGFLEKINVDRGSQVHAGEIIVELSAPELRAQRAQAQAALENAQAQHSVAQARFAADNGTYQHLAAAAKTPGVVAGNDLLLAEKSAAAGSAQVEAAAQAVQAARDNLRSVSELESYLLIRAPFDGVVTQRNLHPGPSLDRPPARPELSPSYASKACTVCASPYPCLKPTSPGFATAGKYLSTSPPIREKLSALPSPASPTTSLRPPAPCRSSSTSRTRTET